MLLFLPSFGWSTPYSWRYVPISLFIGLDHSMVRKKDTSFIDELCKSLFQHSVRMGGVEAVLCCLLLSP
jgi:hypothetical protein